MICLRTVAALAALVVLGVFSPGSAPQTTPPGAPPKSAVPKPAAAKPAAPQRGAIDYPRICLGASPNAPVVIEVFSDIQCPSCRDFYLGTMRQLIADYDGAGKVCTVYRDTPNHKYSLAAARWANAASQLGVAKWFRVTEALYAKQHEWSKAGEVEPVVAAVLTPKELARARSLLEDPKLNAAIDADVARARQLGVTRTPTSFVTANGKTERIPGAIPYDILRRYLDELLAAR